jgi:manganese/iron transport system permease protein
MNFEILLMPFQFLFMQNAFFIVLILSIPTALLSCFLVIKGWALMGDAISHAVLPGIVIAYIAGIPLFIGAFLAGMFCAWSTGFLSENSRIKEDTIMGITFSGMFGFGIVLFVAFETSAHLDHILFGNILGVSGSDILVALIIACLIITFFTMFWRDLMLFSFDPIQAKALALPTTFLHYGLLAVLSLAIIATLKAVGLILAIGLFIIPGAIAFLLSNRLSSMLLISVFVNIFSMLGGLYLSFFIDSAPAPTIILLLTVLFILVFCRKYFIDKRRTNIFMSGVK